MAIDLIPPAAPPAAPPNDPPKDFGLGGGRNSEEPEGSQNPPLPLIRIGIVCALALLLFIFACVALF